MGSEFSGARLGACGQGGGHWFAALPTRAAMVTDRLSGVLDRGILIGDTVVWTITF